MQIKTLEQFIEQIKVHPETIEFQDVLNIIDANYIYNATRFVNGPAEDCVINEAGKNEGSCKIFAFAQIHQLDEKQTLNCFGHYYRDEVLQHPDSSDHGNIRTFMKYGWKFIQYESAALSRKHS